MSRQIKNQVQRTSSDEQSMKPYINISASDGKIIASPLVTKDAKKIESLMADDFIMLSWHDIKGDILPAGAYIIHNGEKYTLLDPYTPEQRSEVEWLYQPQFQSRVAAWAKVPCFFYTNGADGRIISREADWSLTDNAANFIAYIAKCIKAETGQEWSTVAAADLAEYRSIQFSSTDIFSALNSIANAFETEWLADKKTNTLFLGKASFGNAADVNLIVGENVNVPSVTDNREGYFNRFYIFGSTRNITQEYQGANVNNLINKRLTLDPVKYPGGYIDIRSSLSDPILSKVLTFDEVYPKSNLVVMQATPRLMYTLDNSSENGDRVIIGTDSEGNPIYDTYAIWYVTLGVKNEASGKVTQYFLPNTDTYSKDNPDGVLISGKALSIHFKSGALQGREFELHYHTKDETLHNSDGIPFEVKSGMFEIVITKEGDFVIPSLSGIVPAEGDKAILFNLRMPDEYIAGAYAELETIARKHINLITSDRNNYEVASNPIAFSQSNPNLAIGMAVTYHNGAYSYATRVLSLETHLDIPEEQKITVGNSIIKGNTQTLREDVVDAGKEISLLQSFSALAQSTLDGYNRAISSMQEGFSRIAKMWQFDPKHPDCIFTPYNAYSEGGLSAYGFSGATGGGGGGASALRELSDVILTNPAAGQALVYDGSTWMNQTLQQGLNITQLAQYLTTHNYATQTWVNQRGFALASALSNYLPLTGGTMTNTNIVTNLNADMLDGTHKSGLLTEVKMSDMINRQLDVTVGGTKKSVNIYPDNSFGTRVITKPDNAGRDALILISDITAWKGSTVHSGSFGFIGRIIETRANGIARERITDVICRVSYIDVNAANEDGKCLLATSNSGQVKPVIVQRGNNYYLGLKLSGSGHNGTMQGYFHSCLAEFEALLYDASGNLPAGVSILSDYPTKTFTYNASSADKLTTARTLWGQSFNGTGNVSGNMTGVGSITFAASNGSDIDIYGNFKAKTNGGTWGFYRSDGTQAVCVNFGNGNVGIGTNAPAYKLDVNGAIRGTELRLGASPAIEWDAANNAFKVNGNIYATGGITALGAGSDGNTSGGGVSYDRLDSWSDYATDKAGYVLSATLGWDLNTRLQNIYSKLEVNSLLANYVTLNTAQTITGEKTFGSTIKIADGCGIAFNRASAVSVDSYGNLFNNGSGSTWNVFKSDKSTALLQLSLSSGNITVLGNIIKSGGTSSQFLKADGSVDSNNYLFPRMIANQSDISALMDNGWLFASTDGNAQTMTNRPFDNSFLMLTQTCYKDGTDIRRARVAVNAYGAMKLFNDRDTAGNGGAWLDVVTSANYSGILDSRYLKKSGDTMTGALYFGSTNAGIYNSGNILAFKGGDGLDKLVITADTIRRSTQTAIMNLGAADIRWNNLYANTINVASTALVSNLNADMLDGVHYANILERSQSLTFRQVASDATAHWYRVGVTLLANNYTAQSIVSIGRAYWSPQNEGYVFAISVGFGNNININQLSGVQGTPLIDKIRIVWSNNAVAYLDIHVKYPGNTSYANGLYVTSIGAMRTFAQSEVLTDPSTSGLNVFEYDTHAGMGSSAGLYGNASSATKLANTRTLWGQNFNGTGNVSGDITGAGVVQTYKGITTIATDVNTAVNTTAYWYGLGMGEPTKEVTLGGYFGLKLFTRSGMLTMLQNGNVGIGTTNPLDKLHVEGAARVNYLTCNNNTWTDTLEVNNQTYFYGRVNFDNGYFESDDESEAIYCSTDFYAKGGITALATGSTSDMRLKEVVRSVNLDIKAIAGAPSFIHRWKDPKRYAPGEWAGSSAQYWRSVLPQVVSGQKYLALDYGKTALLSAIAIARKTINLETRVEHLEHENRQLKSRLNQLILN